MIGVFITVIGLVIGSFLNVCIYRIPREESIAFPPSHCMKCGKKIKSYDLIPVLSYIFLRGKCRNCGEKISIRYPLIELFTGMIFLLIYLKYGISLELYRYLVFSCFLIVIGMIDYDTTDVYGVVTKTGMFVGVIFVVISYLYKNNAITYIFGAAIAGGAVALIILLGKVLILCGFYNEEENESCEEDMIEKNSDVMGWGDLDICILCGLYLGFKLVLVMLFFSVIIGAIWGVSLIILKKKSRKDYIPFGPFLAIGSFIAILLGQNIIELYLNTL